MTEETKRLKNKLVRKKLKSKGMTDEDKLWWDALYKYIKKDILNYDDNQNIPTRLILRIKGLQKGVYMPSAKNIEKQTAYYSFKVILTTFKYSRPLINRALEIKKFENEEHKFNYILKIIENNINDVYLRMKMADKKAQKENTTDLSCAKSINNKSSYQTTQNKEIKNAYKDILW